MTPNLSCLYFCHFQCLLKLENDQIVPSPKMPTQPFNYIPHINATLQYNNDHDFTYPPPPMYDPDLHMSIYGAPPPYPCIDSKDFRRMYEPVDPVDDWIKMPPRSPDSVGSTSDHSVSSATEGTDIHSYAHRNGRLPGISTLLVQKRPPSIRSDFHDVPIKRPRGRPRKEKPPKQSKF